MMAIWGLILKWPEMAWPHSPQSCEGVFIQESIHACIHLSRSRKPSLVKSIRSIHLRTHELRVCHMVGKWDFKWMDFHGHGWRLGVAGERSSQGHPGSSGSVATAVNLDQAGTGLGHHHLGGLDSLRPQDPSWETPGFHGRGEIFQNHFGVRLSREFGETEHNPQRSIEWFELMNN